MSCLKCVFWIEEGGWCSIPWNLLQCQVFLSSLNLSCSCYLKKPQTQKLAWRSKHCGLKHCCEGHNLKFMVTSKNSNLPVKWHTKPSWGRSRHPWMNRGCSWVNVFSRYRSFLSVFMCRAKHSKAWQHCCCSQNLPGRGCFVCRQ